MERNFKPNVHTQYAGTVSRISTWFACWVRSSDVGQILTLANCHLFKLEISTFLESRVGPKLARCIEFSRNETKKYQLDRKSFSKGGKESTMHPGFSKAELGETKYPKRGKSYDVNHTSDGQTAQVSSQKAEIEKTWNKFVESSTLHGLLHVFSSSTRTRRFLWAVLLLLAIMWFSFQSFKLIEKYYSYQVTTKVSLKYDPMPTFPAVTICNFNVFKRSVVRTSAYEEILPQLHASVVEKMDLPDVNDSIDLNKYHDLNLTQFYIDAGHQSNDTVRHCIWNGKPTCDHRNFTSVLISMGLCHTFNSGKF